MEKCCKRVRFSPVEDVKEIEALSSCSDEDKQQLWLCREDIRATMKSLPKVIDGCVKANHAGSVAYVRCLVETYLACTPTDEDEYIDMKQLRSYLPLLSGQAGSSMPCMELRGLESHLFRDMTKERSQKRKEHSHKIRRLQAELRDSCDGWDVVVADFSASNSQAANRFATLLGEVDAQVAERVYNDDVDQSLCKCVNGSKLSSPISFEQQADATYYPVAPPSA